MLCYPVTLTPDTNETQLVAFVDFPDVHSVGDTADGALCEAVDGLRTAVEMYMDDRRSVPLPSAPAVGQQTVALPAMETAKVLLWNEMLAQKLRKADLARLLDVYQPQVDRLFDLRHSSKVDQIEQAALVMGRRLNVELV
ncbi:type II toxin-antitoxin system HicB family antitoxin [Massilia sp. BJB1822]|uniref:type II toxin-antitoxin system HicB family antitoxin n=1 Tax=Massilia sp. BJB1822 TaxID=2744470 RepID=UPI001594144E|nr:type II toxin-antitoxin system HicB family antitoxin [Massilia sp. BJB1822]NVD99947.1 type II toxin-antitoxin system HicB family antitoxin [Massilia sp. BJB1822]